MWEEVHGRVNHVFARVMIPAVGTNFPLPYFLQNRAPMFMEFFLFIGQLAVLIAAIIVAYGLALLILALVVYAFRLLWSAVVVAVPAAMNFAEGVTGRIRHRLEVARMERQQRQAIKERARAQAKTDSSVPSNLVTV